VVVLHKLAEEDDGSCIGVHPAALLLALPQLAAAFIGRLFDSAHLFFTLPDMMAWLG
jgi:hypothetical protein